MSSSEKRDKFKRLAEKRVNRAIRDLRLIGNLANRNTYEYTEEDVRKIVGALQRELSALRARFETTSGATDTTFTLD